MSGQSIGGDLVGLLDNLEELLEGDLVFALAPHIVLAADFEDRVADFGVAREEGAELGELSSSGGRA